MANIFEIVFKATGLDSLSGKLKSKLGLMAALVGAWQAAKSAFGEYLDKQDALAELNSALERSGQATTAYKEKLEELANELERTAGIADTETLKALGTLTRNGMDPAQAGAFGEALKNLAGILGGDVGQASQMLARALQGNFELFGRMGIKVKDLDGLFAELAARGGGLLEAKMGTIRGQAQNLRNALGDLGESAARAGVLLASALAGSGTDTGAYTRRLAEGFRYLGEQAQEAAFFIANGFSWTVKASEGQRAALKRSSEEMKKAADEARAAAAEEKALAASIDEVVEALDRRARREAAAADAALGLQLAEIDAAEAEGQTTPERAAFQRDEAQRAAKFSALDREERDNKLRREEITRALEAEEDPEKSKKLIGERVELTEQAELFAPRRQALSLQGRAGQARLEKAEKEREEERFEKEAEEGFAAAKKESEELAAEAEYLTSRKLAENDRKGVTKDDALRAVEAAIGRTLTNQERRYREMTGQLERLRKQLENART